MTDAPSVTLHCEVDRAARALHDPQLRPAEILGGLERAVADLGLAREVVYVPGHAEIHADDPDVLAVALHTDDGAVRGFLQCSCVAEGGDWPIMLLASHAAAALDNRARAREARRRIDALSAISEQLQDALLPTLPVVDRTTMHVAYRAASAEARVGGDFYDVFAMPSGRTLIVVGDVMGKGVTAASHTSRITHTLRALALQGLELDTLLERCDEQVSFQDPDIMATVWCGLYEPESGELQFASLGHPPALLLRAEGEPIILALEGLPLGLRDLQGQPPEIRMRQLQPRDLLVLYTDGVVEASGDYLEGQKSLLAAVERRRDEPLAEVLEGVLDEMLGDGGQRDDAAMLLLRRR